MAVCSNCDGKGETMNLEWEEEYDRLDAKGNYPSPWDIRKAIKEPEFISCFRCNGTGKVE